MEATTSLACITRDLNGVQVQQRRSDGYWNATALCRAAGKLFADYKRLSVTNDFIAELSAVMGIPITELIEVRQGGDPAEQGSWVHPRVAIDLARWASPRFAVQVVSWVEELLTTGTVSVGPASEPEIDPMEADLMLMQRQIAQLIEQRRATRELAARQAAAEARQAATDRELNQVKQAAEQAGRTADAALSTVTGRTDYLTLVGYAKRTGIPMPNSAARRHAYNLKHICEERGIDRGRASSEAWDTLRTYPVWLLDEYFGEADADVVPFGRHW